MPRRPWALVTILGIIAGALAGCGGTSSSPAPTVTATVTTTPSPSPSATASPQTPGRQSVSLSVSVSDIVEHDALSLIKDTNAGVRYDDEWRDTNAPKKSAAYRSLKLAAQAGVEALIIVDYAPRKFADPGNTEGECLGGQLCGAADTPAAAKAYAKKATQTAQYCKDLEAELKRAVTCSFELWNEPNLAQFWQPAANPAAYARLANAACTAIKQVNPTFQVALGGLAPSGTDGGNYTPADFLREALDAGLEKDCVDAVGTHPYDGLAQTDEVWDVMQEYGMTAKKIWATEFGWETSSEPGSPKAAADQARFTDFVAEWYEQPYAGRMYYYTQSDDRVPDGEPGETFGLTFKDGRPKAILATFQELVAANS